jgi:hypothetical protein
MLNNQRVNQQQREKFHDFPTTTPVQILTPCPKLFSGYLIFKGLLAWIQLAGGAGPENQWENPFSTWKKIFRQKADV